MSSSRWAIVGGGLLGMTAAYSLARRGQKVTLFEAAPEVGGLASTWDLGGITWDRHYHVTLSSDTALLDLIAELGLKQDMRWKQAGSAFYSDGKLLPFNTANDFLRFPLLSGVEKLRLAAGTARASRLKSGDGIANLSIEEWLTSLCGRAVFTRFWLPLLRAKLGEDYRTTSAKFIWATIRRMSAARRNGFAREQFGYLHGGYARLLDVFARNLIASGVDLRTSAPVKEISNLGQSKGVRVQLRNHLQVEDFDRAIVTVPAPVAGLLCPNLTDSERKAFASVCYSGIICASVLIRKPISPYYITNIVDPSIPFTGLIEMSALVDPREFAHQHLVYLPRYVTSNHPDFDLPEEQVKDAMVVSLLRMHPKLRREDLCATRVSRVRHVFPRPPVQKASSPLPLNSSIRGLHFLNAAHITNGTLNANETVQLARHHTERFYALAS